MESVDFKKVSSEKLQEELQKELKVQAMVSELIDTTEKNQGTYPISLLDEEVGVRKAFFQYIFNNYFTPSTVKPSTFVYKASNMKNLAVVLGIVSGFSKYTCINKDMIYISTTGFVKEEEVEKVHLTEEFIKNAEKAIVSEVLSKTEEIFPRVVVERRVAKTGNLLREMSFNTSGEKKHFVDSIYQKFVKDVVQSIIDELVETYVLSSFVLKTPFSCTKYHHCTISEALDDFYDSVNLPRNFCKVSVILI